MTLVIALKAVVAAAVLVVSSNAPAQPIPDAKAPVGLSGSVGMSVVSLARYEGSPNRRTMLAPSFALSYRSAHWGAVEVGARGVLWHAVEAGDFRVGLALGLDPGRKARDAGQFDPTPGDDRLAGMGDVRCTPEAGLVLGYGPVQLTTRAATDQRGHKGAVSELSASFPMLLTDRLTMNVGVGATWADQKYLQTFYGVTAAQAAATNFARYTPRAGIVKVDLNVGAQYSLTRQWSLQASVVGTELRADAAASPLVARKTHLTTAVGAAYSF